jgi:hypothetical protein
VTLLLFLAAATGEPNAREAFISAYIAEHRDEACGTHWVDNPTHTQCIAMLRREAERLYEQTRR